MGAVAPVLAAEPVAAVAGDGGDDFLLEDAVDESALSAVDQSGDEFVTPVDIDRDLFVVDPGDDIEQALVDRFAVVLVVDIRVVEPEAVAALSADADDEFIDDKILPGFLGDVHPALIGPVFIAPQGVFFEPLVVGTIGLEAPDAHVGVDLPAAGFELFDLIRIVVLDVDDDRFVVFYSGGISVQGSSDDDSPGRRGSGMCGQAGKRRGRCQAERTGQQQGCCPFFFSFLSCDPP